MFDDVLQNKVNFEKLFCFVSCVMVEVDILRTFSSAESIFKLNGIAKNSMVDRYLLCQLRRSQKMISTEETTH